MKRILLACSILICSTAAFAQSEKTQSSDGQKATAVSEYDKAKTEQRNAIYGKFEDMDALIAKEDLAGVKAKYAEAQKMMEQSLESDKNFLKKAKSEEEKALLTRKIDSKQRLYEASKELLNVTDVKNAKRYAVYVMEFANVTQMM